MFKVKNNLITYKNTPVILNGVSVADIGHITGHRDFSYEKAIDLAVKEFHINTLRIPVLPESKIENDWYKSNEYFESRLDPAVKYATELGLYVIIESHHICEFYKRPHFWNNNDRYNCNLKHDLMYFWDTVSKRYGSYENVIFELFNEPTGPDDWHRFKMKVVNIVINVVRNNSQNLILVSLPSSSDISELMTDPVFNKNVAYSTHLYPKFLKSHWKENYKKISEVYPLVVVEWGFSEEVIGGNSDYAEEVHSFVKELDIGLISGFMDTKWEPKLMKNESDLSNFGNFLKNKNL